MLPNTNTTFSSNSNATPGAGQITINSSGTYYVEGAVTFEEQAGGQDTNIGGNVKLVKSTATNTWLSYDRTNISGATLDHRNTVKVHWCGSLSDGDVIQLRVWGRRSGVAHIIKAAQLTIQKF